jgi:hypothetical protein
VWRRNWARARTVDLEAARDTLLFQVVDLIRAGKKPTPANSTDMTDFLHDESLIAPPRTVRIDFDDGSFALRSPQALKPYARCIGEWIERWARETPDALAFAERDESGEGWRKLDYRALRHAVGAVAQGCST